MKNTIVSHFFAPLCAIGLLTASHANAQVLLEENFATAGALTSNGWTQIGSVTTNPLNSAPPALTYPNLPSSGVGNAASLLNTGQDAYRLLSATETGTIYTSIVVTVSAALTGDYFYAFYNQASTGGGYNGRIFIRSNGSGGFNFGVAKNTATAANVSYETTARAFNTPYLVVMKMTRNAGTATDDVASLWINPALGGSESAPDLFNSVGNDNTIGFTSIALRQGGTADAATPRVGNILVGSTWASVTPSANLPAITPAGGFLPFTTFAGTASATQSIGVGGTNLTAGITATAPAGLQVSSDNVTFGPTASLSSVGGTLYARVPSSASAGEVSSSMTLSSTGAADVAVSVTAAVRPNPVPLPYGPETFTTSSFPWYTYTVAGNYNWTRITAGGNSFMEINGYTPPPATGAIPSNAWLILGPFDFPASASNLVASFNLQRAFNDAGSDAEFTFKYSSNYAGIGDPSSATWSDIPFTKPAAVVSSSTVFTPSGAVSLPSSLAGQNGVYVAFQLAATSPTATSRWRVDDFEVFTSSLPVISVIVNPSTINEGSTAAGIVTLPEPAAVDTDVTVTSADGTLVQVNGGASTVVTIPEGFADAQFDVTTTRDFTPGADVPVQVTAESDGYAFGQTIVTVRNIDLPATSLTAGGYTQSFAGFTSEATLPVGWSITASGTATNRLDYSAWASTTTGVKFSSASVNVFGYQHTGSTGTARQTLTLRNDTGETIDSLTISYLGLVARTAEGRPPAYSVTVNDQPVPALAYSTSGDANVQVTSSVSGLSIPPNGLITIGWTSERGGGSGSSKQIGIGEMSVTVGATLLPPTVAGLAVPLATIARTSAEAAADVTSDGGAEVTARGFVYAVTATNPAPEIGGVGVVQLADASSGTGEISATLSGLTAGTTYSIRAYATNSEGTAYTPVATFTTVSPAISFTGSYSQPFNNFGGATPTGWTAVSSGNVQGYGGEWGTESSGGFRGGVSDPGVLGYQHTTTTGTLTVTASFINDSGATIDSLNVSYLGRVARGEQGRTPAWAVSVNGVAREALAYSTGNTEGEEGAPADLAVSAQVNAGLGIAPGAEFTVTWVSTNGDGSGSSRQIGLADFVITTDAPATPSVDVTGAEFNPFSTTEGTPSSLQTVSVSGANLTDDLTVTAPAGFEVSSDGLTYSPSVDLTPTSGSVAATTISVRLTGALVGEFTGNVSFASAGATPENRAVSGTVSSGGETFEGWAQGAPLDQANLLKYAIGGASSPTATDGVAPVTGITATDLTLTAIVRTNDLSLTTEGTALIDLVGGTWSSNGVTMTVDGNQDEVPEGCERQTFTTPRGVDGKKFLRLESTLSGQ